MRCCLCLKASGLNKGESRPGEEVEALFELAKAFLPDLPGEEAPLQAVIDHKDPGSDLKLIAAKAHFGEERADEGQPLPFTGLLAELVPGVLMLTQVAVNVVRLAG